MPAKPARPFRGIASDAVDRQSVHLELVLFLLKVRLPGGRRDRVDSSPRRAEARRLEVST